MLHYQIKQVMNNTEKVWTTVTTMMLRPRLGPSLVARRFFSSTITARQQDSSTPKKPPQPPKPIDDSTSALDYKRTQHVRPPPLPVFDVPRARSAEEAVTNILYNTPPPSLQPYKKCAVPNNKNNILTQLFFSAEKKTHSQLPSPE